MALRGEWIAAVDLAQLVEVLGSADHVQQCVACIYRIGGQIELGGASQREELLRIYQRRERTAARKGYVVPGGDGLVKALAVSQVERVFGVVIRDAEWSGVVFLEGSPGEQCLGCLGSSKGFLADGE